MYENTFPSKRFKKTLEFLQLHVDPSEKILDLGIENPFSEILKENGFQVQNTKGEDLDDDTTAVSSFDGKVVTAFEIFEHLVNPYGVLKAIPCNKLLVSVPLKLWFASAYRNPNDIRDQHYHEFEDWQLDYVLNKAGWDVIDRMKFTNPTKKLGLRPILRNFTDRYYLVYCERS
ncbi:methyltransferase domain-containing protein [Nonlabens agnitus]|uniref:Methyltransferase n=1 Tax=Nonlabens agnitus TaxID=870484 RepID=A0A2S9WR87_9FLAO|nr:methyltransferase [Nonlabens agnitus]PRP66007.1 methyltransferase [Nonlabens agnitus]